FNAGGRQITLGDVEHYLHELRGHVDECRCGRCAAAAMRYPHAAAGRDEAIAAALSKIALPVAPMADRLDKVRRQWEHLRTERERIENERRQREALADLDDEQQPQCSHVSLGST